MSKRLGTLLAFLNIALVPILIGAAAIGLSVLRQRRRSRARGLTWHDGTITGARHPRRRRNLAILGGITALFVVLAVFAVVQQSRSLAPKFEQRPFFPGLADRLSGLGEVDVTSKSGTVHLKLTQGKWVVAERDSFPADLGQIRSAAAGMADLMTVEPKTSRADWLNFVGLSAPDKGGAAVGVKLLDVSGKAMAEVLVGNAQGAADDLGRTMLYVRRPNENQTWLARGSLTRQSPTPPTGWTRILSPSPATG